MKKGTIRLLNILLILVLVMAVAIATVIGYEMFTETKIIDPPVADAAITSPSGYHVIYVDAAAAAGGDGTEAAPFSTIQAAIAAANKGDTIYIRDGEYFVDEPIALTHEHNGITLQAASIAGVRIYGATKLTGWTEGENGIWSIPYSGIEPHTIYEGDTRGIKARYPNQEYDVEFITSSAGYLRTVDTDENNQNRIKFNVDDLDEFSFSNITDASIVIWPWNDCDWAKYTVKIEAIDMETGTITPNYTTDSGAPYGLDARYYIEGMLELLDAPGEFYYDSTEKLLYYKPYHGGDPNEDISVYVPVTDEIFTLTNARDITFRGLSMEKTNFLRTMKIWYNHQETRKGVITMRGTQNITIQNCRFKNTGLNGIYMTSNGNNTEYNLIDGCLFENIGISCVIIESGIRADASYMVGNRISNCLMHDIGEMAVDCAGVNIWSAQQTVIENCEIYNSPRYSVSIRGNCSNSVDIADNLDSSGQSKDNIVRNCLVYYTNQDSGDTGSLHTAGVSFYGENGNTNYFENIYLDHIIPHETMLDFEPNGYFGDYHSNHQSFKNIKVTDCTGETNINRADSFTDLNQFRYNDSDPTTGTYENTSYTLGFQESGLDYTNMGLTEAYPMELLPDVDSIRQSVILKVDSKTALDNGVLITLDEAVTETEVPVINVAHAIGAIVEKKGNTLTVSYNGKTYQTNKTMVPVQEFAQKMGLNLLETDGMMILSQKENLFDTVCDHMTLKRLGNLLYENYQAKYFNHQIIESANMDYTATGKQLKEGEYYMLRSAGSKNATTYAVGKREGKLVYVVREDHYSVPVVQELNTSGKKVRFTKSGDMLTITVDNKQIAQIENPFDAVFIGTYTKTGTENTLVVEETGLSIAPMEPKTLSVHLLRPLVGMDEKVRYYVTLTDQEGNEYDITDEKLTVTMADDTIAEAQGGYILPKKLGSTTITASATVNGTELEGSMQINVVEDGNILLEDSFDANSPSDVVWVVSDLTEGSYVDINDDHKLEIHTGRGNSENISAKGTFPSTSGTVVMEFDFTPDFGVIGDGTAVLAYLLDRNSNFCVSVLAKNGAFVYNSGVDGQLVQSPIECVNGKTYHIHLVANTDTNTFDFYVDDTAVVLGASFRKNTQTLDGVMVGVQAPRVTHWWDNISIYSVENMLEKDYKVENYHYQHITSAYEDYTATGGALQEGEFYMVSTSDTSNATALHAVGKQDGKLVYMTRQNSYSVPTITQLNTEGNKIVFDKAGDKFTVTVDGQQIAQVKNPFADVYIGTYTTTGSDKMTIVKNGMSIAPAVPDFLRVRLSRPEVGLADTAEFVVTLVDKDGKSYDISGSEFDITMSGSGVAEVKDGVILPKSVGDITMTVTANVNGMDISGSADLKIVTVSKILMSDSFDDDELSSAFWTTANTSNDSTIRINEDHQLEITTATGNNIAISAKRNFTPTSGVISCEFDFTPDFGETEGAGVCLVYLQDNKSKYSISTFAYEGAFAYYDYETSSVVQVPMECESGKTYHVRLVADTDKQTYSLYVDGKTVISGEKFRNPADMLAAIFVAGNSSSTKHLWDNILIKLES